MLLAKDVEENFLFVFEVGKDRALTDPGPSRDLAGGRAVEPLLQKHLKGRGGDLFTLLPAQLRVTDERTLLFLGAENFACHRFCSWSIEHLLTAVYAQNFAVVKL